MIDPGCEKTVLIVEDDVDTSDAIAEVLEDGNYRPLRAPKGAAALDELRAAERAPCMILLDMMMPVMDGREFRAQQREDPSARDPRGGIERPRRRRFLRRPDGRRGVLAKADRSARATASRGRRRRLSDYCF